MNAFKTLFKTKYALSEPAFNILHSEMTEVNRKKGDFLIKEGEAHDFVYFIKEGALRSYYINKDGKDVTLWFGFECDIAASLSNFIESKPSLENLVFLEDSTLLKIKRSTLLNLFNSNLELSIFGRKLAEIALLEMEQQILSIHFTDAKSRYLTLIEKFPHILQRVNLGHIASYLGITQVTLSRIRANN
ncbi:Crp/Fnr family transcriptional regulator [Seonamhaeicola sp.]|uniref:Crp/Fnr family transcriptional regulator n=1 Tax=Seonamhaeicola sp. TaxID=1912245 RepID=UPI0026135C5D|nr:Crp/Fnr family transcriptional regulator [Seonamhaeicola sp.]